MLLDGALARGGWRQRQSKQTNIVSLVGLGSAAANRSLRSNIVRRWGFSVYEGARRSNSLSGIYFCGSLEAFGGSA
eukprot:4059979-Pyramimonas_sp.AAC.1